MDSGSHPGCCFYTCIDGGFSLVFQHSMQRGVEARVEARVVVVGGGPLIRKPSYPEALGCMLTLSLLRNPRFN